MVKSLSAVQETWLQSLGQEDPLEKEIATHSSILAWKIPLMEKPGRDSSLEEWKEAVRPLLPDFEPLASVHFSSVTQSCPTLCHPMNRSTPGHDGEASKGPCCVVLSVQLFVTPWTVAYQAPLSLDH